MAAYTIVLEGAAGSVSVTPRFDFTAGTVKVEVEGIYIDDLTSGVEHAAILLAPGEKLEYICSSWDSITRIIIATDNVTSDMSLITLPTSLLNLYISSTSVFGNISGWVALPANLSIFDVAISNVSGDISCYVLPASMVSFNINNTLVDYDSSGGAFEDVTNNLTKIDFDNCSLTQAQVDNVLTDLVTSGITDGVSPKTLDIGGTNAGPSFTGWSKKIMLEARGWTININPFVGTSTLLSRTGQHFASHQIN